VFAQAYECGLHVLLLYGTQKDHTAYGQSLASHVYALLSWLGTSRPFHVVLWWREDPRVLEATEWPTRRHVNGGWTSAGSNAIFVYRSEEWDRVVLHEMIHALEWDWQMPDKPFPCWGLGNVATVYPALFEAWTELLAEWLWCSWHQVSWTAQRQWQDNQAIQILGRQTGTWEENTSIFAYYVLKAALAPHFAFLWIHGVGTAKEREHILCHLTGPTLMALRNKARQRKPVKLSLCMTKPEQS
jgi:hypothetical protein